MMLFNEQAFASQCESFILHPGSRAVFRNWDKLRERNPLPRREEIDIKQFREEIAHLHIIERAPGSIGFRWRRNDFTLMGAFRYSGEGWGLTQDGKRIIMSDGTATLVTDADRARRSPAPATHNPN